MRLLVLNGSPRASRGNTDLLLDALLAGFGAAGGEVAARLRLVSHGDATEAVRAFPEAGAILLAFPLYADGPPAPVIAFVQRLAEYVGRPGNPALLFLVQNGFPETIHMRPVERWLEKLARRLGAPYLGTILKPGAEGMRDQPPFMTGPTLRRLETLGRGLAASGRLEGATLAELARPERFGAGLLGPLRLAFVGRLSRWWWNQALARNGALPQRDERPYAPAGGQ
jgi:hypothetical protein